MTAILASVILLAATALPVRVTLNDLVGMWITVDGGCGAGGQHRMTANGEYTGWCFDSISEGKWSLRSGNKIVIRPDPKKKAEEIITILRFEPQSDRTFLYVRYDDGSREKWMK